MASVWVSVVGAVAVLAGEWAVGRTMAAEWASETALDLEWESA